MTDDPWMDIATRIASGQAVDLDGSVFDEAKPEPECGRDLQHDTDQQQIVPSRKNWDLADRNRVAIGIRVTEPQSGRVTIAANLVAMAIERDMTPVILSTIAPSGFEQFGFRVERLSGHNAEQMRVCEEELKSFWNIDIVIDAADVAKMG